MRISFGELRVGDIAKQRIQASLAKNWVSEGENVADFERLFAEHFGYRHAVAVSSGTDACLVACASLYDRGAQRGDEIIVPACSFVATSNAVLAAGFVPRFVDIELETLNIDPEKIEAALTPRTRAIQVVHTMGKPCKMDPILEIAERHCLVVIEDSCEAHGARHRDRVVGSMGSLAAFSFYAAHLICCGEGGMVVTGDGELERVLRSVRSHGRPYRDIYFDFQRFGLNAKMNDLEAALGIEGLAQFDEVFERRRGFLHRLLEWTRDLGSYAHFLIEEPHEIVAPHAFPLVLRDPQLDRERLYRYLEERGIQCKTLFGSLPTQHAAFAFLGHRPGEFPVAEFVGENGLHFGCHQYLDEDDLAFAAEVLHDYFRSP
ncbi:MAG: DegT/DnrJ/EryC1/StrS family aminotransferase [Myxococcota bacterium]